jgi:hypothetical protein
MLEKRRTLKAIQAKRSNKIVYGATDRQRSAREWNVVTLLVEYRRSSHPPDVCYLIKDRTHGDGTFCLVRRDGLKNHLIEMMGLQGIEWVVLGGHSGGSMQVRTLRRRYSSSRSP